MATSIRFAGALSTALLCVMAAGCDGARDPAPAGSEASADSTAGGGYIGRKASEALESAGEALKKENIRLGDRSGIIVNGRSFGSRGQAGDLPLGEITPAGDLLVEGKAVPVTPEQRALLLGHRRQLEDLAIAGVAIGAQGAGIAGTALTGLGEAMFGGEEGRKAYEARLEAEAARIEQEADKLCTLLPPLHASQQALAASLPAFAPYATMTQEDVDDCGKDTNGDAEDGHGTDAVDGAPA